MHTASFDALVRVLGAKLTAMHAHTLHGGGKGKMAQPLVHALLGAAVVGFLATVTRAEPLVLQIDVAKAIGKVEAVHGVSHGPTIRGDNLRAGALPRPDLRNKNFIFGFNRAKVSESPGQPPPTYTLVCTHEYDKA